MSGYGFDNHKAQCLRNTYFEAGVTNIVEIGSNCLAMASSIAVGPEWVLVACAHRRPLVIPENISMVKGLELLFISISSIFVREVSRQIRLVEQSF